jgi:succinyl-CoA synthetase beta subunit
MASYFLVFLFKNNSQWEQASGAVKTILSAAKANAGTKKVFVNIPDAIDGGFVFRQGFIDALRVYEIDTTKVTRVEGVQNPAAYRIPDNDVIIYYWEKGTLNRITLTK